jgi:hypothetical protein
MLAPKKSAPQGKVSKSECVKSGFTSAIEDAGPKKPTWSNLVLTSQNSNQRERHDCTRQDCQRHPTAQLRMRSRQAQHVDRRVGAVKNLCAGCSFSGRERFR